MGRFGRMASRFRRRSDESAVELSSILTLSKDAKQGAPGSWRCQ